MKFIGTIIAIFLILGFTMVGFGESPSQDAIQTSAVENTSASKPDTNTFSLSLGTDQGEAIFSLSSVVSLLLVVIGIVAFRQNSYI